MSQADDLMRAEIEGRQNEIESLKEELSAAKQTVKDIRARLEAVKLRGQRDALQLKILNGEKLRSGGGRKPKAVETSEDVVANEPEAVAA